MSWHPGDIRTDEDGIAAAAALNRIEASPDSPRTQRAQRPRIEAASCQPHRHSGKLLGICKNWLLKG